MRPASAVRGWLLAAALLPLVTGPVPGVFAAASASAQSQYLYYWNHDADFNAQQCANLPQKLQPACLTAANAIHGDPRTASETRAQREEYLVQYHGDPTFPVANCPLLPSRYVTECLATASSTPAIECAGASGTICEPTASVPASERAAFAVLDASPGQSVTFPADPTVGVTAQTCGLTRSGPVLLFSDDPERVPGPGILYQDTVSGRVRVFLYHQNFSAQPLYFGVVLTNPAPGNVIIGVSQSGAGGPSSDAIAVGKQATRRWMQSSPSPDFTIPGNSSVFLDPTMAGTAVAPKQIENAIYDFTSSAPIQVSVVAESAPSTQISGLSVLPSTHVTPQHTPMRGTFTGADPSCRLETTLPWSGELVLRFGADKGNYLAGTSAVDNNQATIDYGNYGVLYTVQMTLTSPSGALWSTYALLLHPHTSIFAAMSRIDEGSTPGAIVSVPENQPYVSGVTHGVVLDRFQLAPLVSTTTTITWMTAASSSLPIDLLVYPVY